MIFVYLGLIFRVVITLYVSLFEVGHTLTYDSIRFYEDAINYSRYLSEKSIDPQLTYNIKNYFSVVLGSIFHIFKFETYLLSSLCSNIIWFLSAIVFYKILLKLNYKKKTIYLSLFLYSFIFPTSIVYTSLLLREPYILLFLNLLVLYLININSASKKITFNNLVPILFVSFCLFFLHNANQIFLTLLFLSLFFFFLHKKFNIPKYIKIIIILVSIYLLFDLGISERIFYSIKSYLSGHFFAYNFERATYFLMEDITSLEYSTLNFVLLITKNFINYLFQPFIFNVSSLKDLLLLSENILRFIFILMILKKFILSFDNKKYFYLLFFMYFLMELIYAQATVNWGTASRHHVPSIGLLILSAYFPTQLKKKLIK
tara:strand:- start:1033 stop:2151 length:1119 start_codon:yes stop_codon:yes gene_type:complete